MPYKLIHATTVVAFLAVLFSLVVSNETAFGDRGTKQGSDAAANPDQLFKPAHLLKVDIQVDPADWDTMRKQSRDFFGSLSAEEPVDSPFDYVKADVTIDGRKIKQVGIRKKGFLGSLDENRPSLKIRFDRYRDQSPFGELDRITLNNNKQDPSKLSQYLSYKLFAEAGVPSPRCNFAVVTVNGKSLGVYSHVESLKPPMLKRVFGDGSGLLAEGTLADFLPSAGKRFEYKKKLKNKTKTKIHELTDYLQESEIDVQKLDELVDLESFLTYWATESLIGFWDGYSHNQNNFFVYENPQDTRLYFLPWGTDSAFTTDVPRVIEPIANLAVHSNSALANHLYRLPETRERYLATLRSLLASTWDEAELLDEIERVEKMLSTVVLSESRFHKDVERVREFVKTRRGAIEKQLEQWPIALEVGPRSPGLVIEYGGIRGGFETIWTKETPDAPEAQGETSAELKMASKEITLTKLGVTTKLSDHYNDKSKDGIRSPTIIFTGVRESDGKTLTFIAKVRPEDFYPAKKEVPVNGVLIEGSLIAFFTMLALNPAAIKLINGTVQLDEASLEEGAAVAGKADLKIVGFSAPKRETIRWSAD
ncbi:MAG: CotH kinase family protein [Rubripirellula sp.]|nr:CotH kinase family protein [Rubripirellula sp.]